MPQLLKLPNTQGYSLLHLLAKHEKWHDLLKDLSNLEQFIDKITTTALHGRLYIILPVSLN
ncbi:MAG: hypothetical protein RCG15_03625 [Candidatus Rickettsia vulgarisii]